MAAPRPITRSESASSKRSRSEISQLSSSPVAGGPTADVDRLPAFLQQTRTEISEKFNDLEWLQRDRLYAHSRPNSETLASDWVQERSPETKVRNRYANVRPWAKNRIHLNVPLGHCDYINASPILLKSSKSKRERKHIATQGPKDDQLHHIWRMIWHETSDPAIVVMLTQTIENGKEKCAQYYPENMESDTMILDNEEFGDGIKASLKLLECSYDMNSRTTVRKIRLTVGEDSKIVWHLLFGVWPDFSVPEGADRIALIELIKYSSALNTAAGSPSIIHCSAGVGRSGTFIALDHLLSEINEGTFDDFDGDEDVIFETVDMLRKQRMSMVQSEPQLNLIYQLLKEKWLERQAHLQQRRSSSEERESRAIKVAKKAHKIDVEIGEFVEPTVEDPKKTGYPKVEVNDEASTSSSTCIIS
ncbi:MAG: hypothetical protein M1829_002547 [Trizodia sp. TS-e1964]|nr:MAG: hypothetical protein M1829_002547 [Trizodia sp. TS-e1964]